MPGSRALSNARQKLINEVAHLPLTERPRFALVGLVPIAKFEFRNRNWTIFSIPFRLLVLCESPSQNVQRFQNDRPVLTVELLAEGFGNGIYALWRMFDAVDEIPIFEAAKRSPISENLLPSPRVADGSSRALNRPTHTATSS